MLGAERSPVAVGVNDFIAPLITASIVGDLRRSYAGLQASIRLSRFVGVGSVAGAIVQIRIIRLVDGRCGPVRPCAPPRLPPLSPATGVGSIPAWRLAWP